MKPATSHTLRRKQMQEACKQALRGYHVIRMGQQAGWLGKAISTCPKKLSPQLRKTWLKGWRLGRKEYNMLNWIFRSGREWRHL